MTTPTKASTLLATALGIDVGTASELTKEGRARTALRTIRGILNRGVSEGNLATVVSAIGRAVSEGLDKEVHP